MGVIMSCLEFLSWYFFDLIYLIRVANIRASQKYQIYSGCVLFEDNVVQPMIDKGMFARFWFLIMYNNPPDHFGTWKL